ncbi:hypothetical protein ACHMW4_06475 [Mesorhizobium sp. UC22_110]|uniref:hypothetical protein n=1 Tax=Mesorhizobium sp. UC22_110 TaxID=3374552 RepID=UPI0037579A6A
MYSEIQRQCVEQEGPVHIVEAERTVPDAGRDVDRARLVDDAALAFDVDIEFGAEVLRVFRVVAGPYQDLVIVMDMLRHPMQVAVERRNPDMGHVDLRVGLHQCADQLEATRIRWILEIGECSLGGKVYLQQRQRVVEQTVKMAHHLLLLMNGNPHIRREPAADCFGAMMSRSAASVGNCSVLASSD